jgi:YhgE/Pip-like protein
VPIRARQLLTTRGVWVFPLVAGSILLVLLTAFYVGSVVDPVGHLHGLPAAIVNQDRGATVGGRRIDFGQQVQAGLSRSPAVADRLSLSVTTRQAAEQAMDRDGSYAAVLIPADFTASLLRLAGEKASGPGYRRPEIFILVNQRAGTEGASLATDVLEPALQAASRQIGRKLIASMPARSATPVTRAVLADPVTVTTTQYRPLPSHSALGLSAFYVALLTLMCGFLGGVIVNSSVDAALGYATTEIGPRWRQRRPQLISRWQTLIVKWVVAVVAAGLLTGLMLLVAAGLLRMDAPHIGLLWLLTWLAATSVAEGTIVLFAVLGTSIGQLLAMLLFVYAGLASAGGTVPLQALPAVLRWLAEAEPLRQILAGTRATLYFNAQADAGLTRAVVAAACGLVFWLAAGTVLVHWYDRRGLSRIDPLLLEYVDRAAQDYVSSRNADPAPQDSASQDSAPQDSAPQDSAPQDSAPRRRPAEPGG